MQRLNFTKLSTVFAAASLVVAGLTSSEPARAEMDEASNSDSVSAATTAVPAPVTPNLLEDTGPDIRKRDQTDSDPRVLEYWTPERMKNATAVDTPSVETSERQASADLPSQSNLPVAPLVKIAEPAPAADAPVRSLAPEPVTNFSPTNGKVFYTKRIKDNPDPLPDEYGDFVCSGSAVNSASKRLVITAGHCVHGGSGGTWHRNWVFVPKYKDGQRPHGTFQAATLRTYTDWMDYGNSGRGFNSDVAFVATRDNENGRKVVDAVGGHGLWSGGSYVFDVTIFGYPGNKADGERMWACWGTTHIRSIGAYRFPSITGCDFGGGSSGGPWIYQYSNVSGLGYVRSVTSHGPRDSNEYISGPYFDERAPKLYSAADQDGGTL